MSVGLPNVTPDEHRIMEIFYPHMMEKVLKAICADQKFVHYSDAEAALSMIQNKEVWMRNTTWMNDTSEIKYGIERLTEAAGGVDDARLRKSLEEFSPGICKEFDDLFLPWLDDFQEETYITCLTEQLDSEELIGRLSMWRAYGTGKAVCFVLNGGPMLRPSEALNAYTSPVAYSGPEEFNSKFRALVDNITSNMDFLKTIGRDTVFNHLFAAFRWAVICTKHPSFYEEREWRVVHQPNFKPSTRLIEDTRVIAGAPQRIYKIPLQDYPEEGFYGATLPDLLVRVIIGPSSDANNLRREFIRLLKVAGVSDANEKVAISDIPLRI